MGQDLSAKSPVLSSTSVRQKAPFTQTREKSVARQLDDSFADLHTGARRQTRLDQDNEGPSTSFLMSEIQKLSEEVRIRDQHHRISEIQRDEDMRHLLSSYKQKDDDMRQLISDCQRKDEMIMSLVASLKDQMTVLGSAAKAKLVYDEHTVQPERLSHCSEKLPSSTSTEQRPEMAKRSEEVLVCSGKNVLRNSDASKQTPKEEQHASTATEAQVTDKEMQSKSDTSVTGQSLHKALCDQISSSRASNSGVKVKPATFDGSTSWLDYKSHFDMCSELDSWNNKQKGLHLAVSLRVQAQGVLGNLPATDRENYEKLAKAVSERFSPESQTELYRAQLKEMEWKHGDNVAEFAQRILRLTTLSYPRADTALVDSLAMEYFIDAISDAEMRLKIQQTRPKDLNEAIKVAIELEAFDRAERQRRGLKYARGSNNTDEQIETFDLRKLTNLVQQEIKKASSSKESSKWGLQEKGQKRRACFICDDENHLARSCPKQKCYIFKGLGHRAFDCPKKYRIKKPERVAPKETDIQGRKSKLRGQE